MIKDVFNEASNHFASRLRDPLLGAFTFGWLIFNWKAIGVLLFSEKMIEERIEFIDGNYFFIQNLILFPLLFSILVSLIGPWISLGVQKLQMIPNEKRRNEKIDEDTRLFVKSKSRAEAKAELNRILAEDEISRKLKDEISSLKDEVTAVNADYEKMKNEVEIKQKEYDERENKDTEEAELARKELETLRKHMESERLAAKSEESRVRKELEKRQAELESRLSNSSIQIFSLSGSEFERELISNKFRLYHNPGASIKRSKVISFAKDGKIIGGNHFENRWRIVDGRLELLESGGDIHSRFYFLPKSHIFVHTGDKDTSSAEGQFIIPEPEVDE
ncbi:MULTISPECIES: coiled-coil domain-containing protein [unclassified Ketobacter]|uniref:coiled-coil domain-containing protein n=1 Tax=unclassified Ketobacter TaxID=2639109 RepID=UPI000F248CC0|nr:MULTISPECIES: cell envelope integrity protein TolA [unclassified Ketobacter]RLT87506.1 MAG: hypothetical protein D9N13_20675 [Ketobacter sp. GenoA1]RLT93352.1 MAG: hypothetical protein D9N15_20890 [Ketobacter sp.]